jgi:methylthioribose-1-phosphate isomerase
VAPSSTVDMDTASGELIEIEERDPGELHGIGGVRIVAEGIKAWNPVFDVTPGELIDAIVTEKGVVERPTTAKMRAAFD